ncbi:MAG: nucleotidyltransferase family protein, partial [Thermodesulfobacteriota bacterium]
MKPNKLDSQLISILEKHKSELKTRFNVESLSIFGSFSRGTAGPESDLDILV